MAIGCGPKLAKCLLIIFNVVFWLSGLILIVIPSIYLSNEKTKIVEKLDKFNSRGLFIGVLVLGIIIFVIAFCGCCGAVRESKLLLGMYIVFLMLIIFIQVALGIFAIFYKQKIEKSVSKTLKTAITELYGYDKDNDKITDNIQQILSCCGIEGPQDWEKSKWYIEKMNKSQMFPKSCCRDYSECYNKISGATAFSEGCVSRLREYLQRIFPIFIGVILGIAFFEIFVVICAFCLCRNTGSHVQEV